MFLAFWLVLENTGFAIAQTRPAIKGSPIPGQAFGAAFSESFNGLVKGLLAKKCIGTIEGRTTDLTFAGILPENPHLSQSQTLHINALTQKWIRRHHGNYINISSSQELGTLASLDYTSPSELHKTILHHMKNAPLFLLVTTARPFPDILQLKVALYGRKEGSSFCNGKDSFYLHLPTRRVITLSGINPAQRGRAGHYIDYSKAYRYGLKQVAKNLWDAKIAYVLPSFEDKAPCDWHDREADLFDNQYFALKTEASGQLDQGSGQFPRLRKLPRHYGQQKRVLPSPVRETVLTAHWSRPDISRRIIRVTLSVHIRGDLENKTSYFIIADKAQYKNCPVAKPVAIVKKGVAVKKRKVAPKKKQAGTGQAIIRPVIKIPVVQPAIKPELTFHSEKRVYRKGEAARFIIESNVQCRLTLINIDSNGTSCLLFPHKDLADTVLKPGQKFIYPPLGQLTLDERGQETYIALCNPTDSDIATVVRNTRKIDCSKTRNDKQFSRHVNEIATFSVNAPTLRTPFKRQDILLRSRITVFVR